MPTPSQDLARDLAERAEHLTATRTWPWQLPGAISSGLNETGPLTRYLATGDGLVPLDPAPQ